MAVILNPKWCKKNDKYYNKYIYVPNKRWNNKHYRLWYDYPIIPLYQLAI